MAATAVSPPAILSQTRRMMSTSTSPRSSTSSSASPRTATTFSFSVGYADHGSPSSPSSEGVVPKVEELDDDDDLMETKTESLPEGSIKAASTGSLDQSSGPVARRPRGRPRKHPKTSPMSNQKQPKGRSKTGCITCRRRKKKCDETRPACLHCQKNNVHCEGYPPKDYWQGRTMSIDRPRELPLLIEGIETETDWFFFDHFNMHLSRVLSLFTDRQNPFKEILLPMATTHQGLMHSVLCLSGAHLVAKKPNERFAQRQYYHFHRAVNNLRTDLCVKETAEGDDPAVIDDPTVAQVLVLCLKSICAGETNGEYRPHLDAAKTLIRDQPSRNPEFRSFLLEFFVYHDVSNSITSMDRPSMLMSEDFQLPEFIQPEAGIFLGVTDGIFLALSRARQLRDKVRARRNVDMKPIVDYQILTAAAQIDHTLRTWVCQQPTDTPRYAAAFLYRQCAWVYLQRTIMPSHPNPRLQEAVDEGLVYLRELPEDSSTLSVLLMPLFILGVSAFVPEQRPHIQKAFADLQAYSNLGNIKYAKMTVEKVWELMDAGDEKSWDWEAVMENMGWDFLVT
ncbi:hypothetical protein EJ08DRAFT_691893 [Tothia fuscella]|uniref:Zn(2)-C6 fungal-type domain-containing protein n=1 Tax=Tothia fuscella TaxID=1048955 RepID=A0A9P4P0L6_9PEZI|nr:hypothetical protein EJ08DRAFT_691893 [Tothia fuscella]